MHSLKPLFFGKKIYPEEEYQVIRKRFHRSAGNMAFPAFREFRSYCPKTERRRYSPSPSAPAPALPEEKKAFTSLALPATPSKKRRKPARLLAAPILPPDMFLIRIVKRAPRTRTGFSGKNKQKRICSRICHRRNLSRKTPLTSGEPQRILHHEQRHGL